MLHNRLCSNYALFFLLIIISIWAKNCNSEITKHQFKQAELLNTKLNNEFGKIRLFSDFLPSIYDLLEISYLLKNSYNQHQQINYLILADTNTKQLNKLLIATNVLLQSFEDKKALLAFLYALAQTKKQLKLNHQAFPNYYQTMPAHTTSSPFQSLQTQEGILILGLKISLIVLVSGSFYWFFRALFESSLEKKLKEVDTISNENEKNIKKIENNLETILKEIKPLNQQKFEKKLEESLSIKFLSPFANEYEIYKSLLKKIKENLNKETDLNKKDESKKILKTIIKKLDNFIKEKTC